ncbi:hypothetical protein [Marinobacter sp.]|uniref:hypothetical protein n=1 Tax=Marinobacter sp. TaxID=50741 RepID=UPI00356B6056
MTIPRLLMFCLLTLPLTQTPAHSTLSDITDGNEEQVTLPVVPGSKLLIHATRGIDISSGDGPVQSLPLAAFLTRQSPEDVVAWYREALPDYTVLTDKGGQQVQILRETGPDTTVDSPDTYRIPNIRIRPTDARLATHMKGARTMVQVYYPPAENQPTPEGDS